MNQIFAAPAPSDSSTDPEDDVVVAAALPEDTHLDELCEELARWCRTRRFYGAPQPPASLLGRLQARTRPLKPGGPDARNSAELAALYLALVAQPQALDRIVFEAYYLQRVANVKSAAGAIGISRNHWYRLLREFRRRIYLASKEILAVNEAAAQALPHRN